MSTASGLSTEDLASNLLGTKGGSGLEACFAPQNIAVSASVLLARTSGSARRRRWMPWATAMPRSSRKARISFTVAVRSATRRQARMHIH